MFLSRVVVVVSSESNCQSMNESVLKFWLAGWAGLG